MGKKKDERERLIGRIVDQEARLQKAILGDRPNSILSVDLTIPQLKVLVTLAFSGRASGRELSEALGVGLATVTGIVDRLAARGLVERHEDPRDRRIRRVFITGEGKKITDGLINAGLEAQERLIRQLDVGTLRSLEGVNAKLLDAAGEEAERDESADKVARTG